MHSYYGNFHSHSIMSSPLYPLVSPLLTHPNPYPPSACSFTSFARHVLYMFPTLLLLPQKDILIPILLQFFISQKHPTLTLSLPFSLLLPNFILSIYFHHLNASSIVFFSSFPNFSNPFDFMPQILDIPNCMSTLGQFKTESMRAGPFSK